MRRQRAAAGGGEEVSDALEEWASSGVVAVHQQAQQVGRGGVTNKGGAGGRPRSSTMLLLKLGPAGYYYVGLLLVTLVLFREANRPTTIHNTSGSWVLLEEENSRAGRQSASSSSSDAMVTRTTLEEGAGRPTRRQQQHDERSTTKNYHDDRACSCYDRYANVTCCQRQVLTSHKFGLVLTRNLFWPFRKIIGRMDIHPNAFPFYNNNNNNMTTQDYRHVVVVRNFPEAIVSGYLYHKSGRECWLTYYGAPLEKEWNFDWERDLRVVAQQSSSYYYYDVIRRHPPRNNRSICRYLADEPVPVGMTVYMAVALAKWYHGIDDYYRIVEERRRKRRKQQQKEQQVQVQDDRTLFLCLEDYPDHKSQERLFDVMMDWLYPGGHNFTVPPKAINRARDGHASPGNNTERQQLLNLVMQLDHDVFNGTVATTNAIMGCRGTIHRTRR